MVRSLEFGKYTYCQANWRGACHQLCRAPYWFLTLIYCHLNLLKLNWHFTLENYKKNFLIKRKNSNFSLRSQPVTNSGYNWELCKNLNIWNFAEILSESPQWHILQYLAMIPFWMFFQCYKLSHEIQFDYARFFRGPLVSLKQSHAFIYVCFKMCPSPPPEGEGGWGQTF